jgi:hypothetical protein
VLLLLLAYGVVRSRVWLRSRATVPVILAVVALLYPLIPAGHVTQTTSEIADRAAGFVFVGLAFVVAWSVLSKRARWWSAARVTILGTLLATLVFFGGTVSGTGPDWLRLPGPYLVEADNRTVDALNVAAAQWTAHNVAANSRVLSDRINRLLQAEIGRLYAITHVGDGVDASPVFFDTRFSAADRALIKRARIAYLVVDRRLSTGLPRVGVYLEQGEQRQFRHPTPVSQRALTKFDSVPGVARIYDNGAVVIYDLRRLDAS